MGVATIANEANSDDFSLDAHLKVIEAPSMAPDLVSDSYTIPADYVPVEDESDVTTQYTKASWLDVLANVPSDVDPLQSHEISAINNDENSLYRMF